MRIMDTQDIPLISEYADILQVGARNMQNFSLLKMLGKCNKPILLKRGLSATMRDFLMAAEYIVAYGNTKIILCERGIRTFETITRNTVDINAVPLIKEKSHLPIIIDASHGTGRRSLVEPVTLAGVIAGQMEQWLKYMKIQNVQFLTGFNHWTFMDLKN